MKIFLFGGAFDPPHLGHQYITKNLLKKGLADEVWYVPVKSHPFSKQMSSVEHRLAMLNLLINGDFRIKIETYELEKQGVSYSHETLDALAKKYPEHEFSWVIGSDNLNKFHLWSGGEGRSFRELLKNYSFYVYPRQGFEFSPLYENMIALEEMKEVVVSSTNVREALSKGESILEFVDPKVAEFIEENGLYQS
ncbi:MAG: nicotinate (nicotinamide) nucleotide adenylyltransferase [Candidatus Pacebacteria bacterium]|jgi:nicotinate-nucleotide adenylyltransferase|nr:nicotinate (nicotinamide) nucleotide adenylyltransferase [Candidatus Paceibacterota bacterium]MBT4652752.1 nicotinate (nicotinamide) nucleotide adenylyltransferase [Candidatus Paceibacterota bacterium]MBT6755909.1 nicotinate (nicotinamide) nucleotide adenylyltransferase [Candidatus Paceibacterota bacterium]MBT6921122.1 nicotinate (nicotinamide) nucleotide adenylyltransferase [Candidatus Paceibacterota bacterium]